MGKATWLQMPLVAIDSNIIDEIAHTVGAEPVLADAMESLSPPPVSLPRRAYAWYWLLALAPYWVSCLYTFSDTLYQEVAAIPGRALWRDRLLGLGAEIREAHPEDLRDPDPTMRPDDQTLIDMGLSSADSEHIADAVGLGVTHFLTYDKGILKRSQAIRSRWGLTVVTPEDFLVEAVRSGAPWPARVPWPWDAGPLSTGFPETSKPI